MKKVLLVFFALNSFYVIANIQKPNLEKYYKQKKLGSKLGDFNKINETFNIGYDSENHFNLNNKLTFGYLEHEITYNTKEKKTTNTIGISKNLRDFAISKKKMTLNEFYTNKDRIMQDYFETLDIYSKLIVKRHEIFYLKDTIEKIRNDRKIIDTQYKVGAISKIEYDTIIVDLLAYENKVNILENEIIELLDALKQYGIIEKIEDIKDFELKTFNEEALKKYIMEENEKINISNELKKQKRIHSVVPDIIVGARYTFETKSYGVNLNINKLFTLDGSDITETNMSNVPNKKKLDLKNEIAKYDLLYRTYTIDKKKELLASETYKVNKTKNSVGKLSYKELTDSKLKLDDAKINLVKSKNNLALYFLKRGM